MLIQTSSLHRFNMKKIAFDERTMELLKGFAKPTGIGAGLGALGMGAANMMSDDEDQHTAGGLGKSMLLGAGLGGAMGAGYHGFEGISRPDPKSPAGQMASGLPAAPKATANPAAIATDPWVAGPASGGVGYLAQRMYNKAHASPEVKDVPQFTWKGYNANNPLLNNVLAPKHMEDAAKANLGPDGKGIDPKFNAAAAGDKFKTDAVKTHTDEANAISKMTNPQGGLNHDALQKIITHSAANRPNLEFEQNGELKAPWQPNVPGSENMSPDNLKLHSIRDTLGPDLANKMSPLQKVRAAIQNPLAELAGKVLPEDYTYGKKSFPGMDKVRDTMNDWQAGAHNKGWGTLEKLLSKITPEAPGAAPRNIDPTRVQPEAMKKQMLFQDAIDPHPETGRYNRFAYHPEAKIPMAIARGKMPTGYGMGGKMVGPGVAAGLFGASQFAHDHTMLNLYKETFEHIAKTKGPEAAAQWAQQLQQGTQQIHSRGVASGPNPKVPAGPNPYE
jgi:hypothetical protein